MKSLQLWINLLCEKHLLILAPLFWPYCCQVANQNNQSNEESYLIIRIITAMTSRVEQEELPLVSLFSIASFFCTGCSKQNNISMSWTATNYKKVKKENKLIWVRPIDAKQSLPWKGNNKAIQIIVYLVKNHTGFVISAKKKNPDIQAHYKNAEK